MKPAISQIRLMPPYGICITAQCMSLLLKQVCFTPWHQQDVATLSCLPSTCACMHVCCSHQPFGAYTVTSLSHCRESACYCWRYRKSSEGLTLVCRCKQVTASMQSAGITFTLVEIYLLHNDVRSQQKLCRLHAIAAT